MSKFSAMKQENKLLQERNNQLVESKEKQAEIVIKTAKELSEIKNAGDVETARKKLAVENELLDIRNASKLKTAREANAIAKEKWDMEIDAQAKLSAIAKEKWDAEVKAQNELFELEQKKKDLPEHKRKREQEDAKAKKHQKKDDENPEDSLWTVRDIAEKFKEEIFGDAVISDDDFEEILKNAERKVHKKLHGSQAWGIHLPNLECWDALNGRDACSVTWTTSSCLFEK